LPLADAFLAAGILGTVVVATNLDPSHMPGGLKEFLAFRVTLKNILLLAAFGLTWPAVLWACGLYAPARQRSGGEDWPRLVLASAIGAIAALVFPLTSASGAARPEHSAFFGAAVLLATAGLRGTLRVLRGAGRGDRPRQIIIVGSGPLAARLVRELRADPVQASAVVGFVDSEPHAALTGAGVAHLGAVEDLEHVLMRHVVDDVVIGLPIKSRYDAIRRTIAACERVGVPAKYPADLFRTTPDRSRPEERPATPFLSFVPASEDSRRLIKRSIDLTGATLLLSVLTPVMLLVALAVKLTSPGPILFAQQRYGHLKRRFSMYKFRTMVSNAEQLQAGLEERNEAEGPVFKIRKDPRLTRPGRFLRRTSLDELPQLWNVLQGQMSLVGPRPMSVRDVGLFEEPWLMRRFCVRPGLTCLWQVRGRSNLSFEQWIALDLEYIDRWSLTLDVMILLLTIPAVLTGRGAD
jgi:exopolysaccharide biosynthesis polyprenyl glycosylphosphotransferase